MGLLTTPSSPLRSRLYTNAAYLWLSTLAIALLGFAFWTIVSRLHTPVAVGLAGTAVTALILLAEVSQLGLGQALIRYLPHSGDEAPSLMGRSVVGAVAASLTISLAFMSSLPWWSPDLSALLWQGPGQAVGYLTFVVFATTGNLLRAVLVAYLRSRWVLTLTLATQLLRFPLPVVLGGLGMGWTFGIVASHGLAVLGATLLGVLVYLPKCTGRRTIPLTLDLGRLAPLVPFALSNLTSSLFTGFSWIALPLVVITLGGAEAAGFFFIAWTIAGIVLNMTQQLALSLFAEGSNGIRGFRPQAQGALLVGIAMGGVFAVGTFFLGDLVLRLFGGEYVERSSTVLKLMAAASPLAAVTQIYLGIERVSGRMAPLVALSALVGVIMLGVTVVLVPRIGIAGAGYGVLAGYGVGALASLSFLYAMMTRGHQLMELNHGKVV